MSDFSVVRHEHDFTVVPAMSRAAIAQVEAIDEVVRSVPQVGIATQHVLHAGVYTRTICIPAGTILTGALIKIATTLTVCGHVVVLIGEDEAVEINGYRVLAASAGRKQAYIAYADTWLSMAFRTDARTVEEAEEQFTDEADKLFSRRGANEVTITGE